MVKPFQVMYGTQTLNLITTFGSALGSSLDPLFSLSNVLQEKETDLHQSCLKFNVVWG